MKLLHLDSSIMGDASASRAISAAVVEQVRETHPGIEVIYRDLASEPLPHMTFDTFMALDKGEDVQQFLDSDIVVIGVGFYNFSIPSQLKAWVDRIAVKGKTFGYSENGPVGLVTGKRVIVALARGNVYGEGSPYTAYELPRHCFARSSPSSVRMSSSSWPKGWGAARTRAVSPSTVRSIRPARFRRSPRLLRP